MYLKFTKRRYERLGVWRRSGETLTMSVALVTSERLKGQRTTRQRQVAWLGTYHEHAEDVTEAQQQDSQGMQASLLLYRWRRDFWEYVARALQALVSAGTITQAQSERFMEQVFVRVPKDYTQPAR